MMVDDEFVLVMIIFFCIIAWCIYEEHGEWQAEKRRRKRRGE